MSGSFRMWPAVVGLALGLCLGGVRSDSSPQKDARRPASDTAYVSRRCVMKLFTFADGAIGAQTTGGFLRRGSDGVWRVDSAPTASPSPPTYNGEAVTIAAGEVRVGNRTIAFPNSAVGAHVTAVAVDADGKSLLCALWDDDSLYCWNPAAPEGARWARRPTGLPGAVGAQITAVVETDRLLCVGTRREGVWERSLPNGDWRPVPLTQAGPYNDDAEALCTYKGAVYISTLEDGLDVLDATGWRRIAVPAISTEAPRQLVVYRDALYVRHGSGVVDRIDGGTWTRNIWVGQLPHKEVSALATDGTTLYAAQWGGWSGWNGAAWTHHLDQPGLEGTPVTALLPDRDGMTLWVGTQGKGLAEVDVRTGAIRRWHDERRGMPDDWITCLAQSGDTIYAGTFVAVWRAKEPTPPDGRSSRRPPTKM